MCLVDNTFALFRVAPHWLIRWRMCWKQWDVFEGVALDVAHDAEPTWQFCLYGANLEGDRLVLLAREDGERRSGV